jgi:uncharacterized membrane protein (DUF2068 family)
VIGFFSGFLVFAILGGVGLLTGDVHAVALLTLIGFLIAVFVAVLSVPNLICGWGLLKRKSWSRIFALVLGCLGLLSFPLGTAIGVYSLWALTQPEAERILSN